jgi:hypothetical protein
MEDIEVFTMDCSKVYGLMKDGSIEHGLVLNALMFYAMTRPDFFSQK